MNQNDPYEASEEASYICYFCKNEFDVLGTRERDEIDNRMYFYPFDDKHTICCGVEADLI